MKGPADSVSRTCLQLEFHFVWTETKFNMFNSENQEWGELNLLNVPSHTHLHDQFFSFLLIDWEVFLSATGNLNDDKTMILNDVSLL